MLNSDLCVQPNNKLSFKAIILSCFGALLFLHVALAGKPLCVLPCRRRRKYCVPCHAAAEETDIKERDFGNFPEQTRIQLDKYCLGRVKS